MMGRKEVASVLTMAYCRVSTEEQAEEGFSMEGQADKLRSYAQLRDLGEVTVVEDPGLSGKDMARPGLQRLLEAVRAGHVAHVLVWRLDRLSRNRGDLILLADTFGEHEVALHSVQENLDLSSAAGRMFYNILGAFAQFFREQLAENVKMGNERAVREGRHINRPKTGYSLVDGLLVPNEDAERVREVFRLRAGGMSLRDIEARTGLKWSMVGSILQSRVYLGEVPHNGQWFPGRHEPLVTEEEFAAANRGFVPGRRRGRDLLSGRVRCGLCGKRMPIDQNGEGRVLYRCRHRGQGCRQPARTNLGLVRAAVLGMALIGQDERLREAIRRQLAYGQAGDPAKAGARRPRRRSAAALKALTEQRRKLLELYYEDGISKELFSEEEQRLTRDIEAVRAQVGEEDRQESLRSELVERFEQVAKVLQELDVQVVWGAAEDTERRVLVEELVDGVTVFPDHLEVTVAGAPPLNVLYSEVGLKESETVRVGGGTHPIWYQALAVGIGAVSRCRHRRVDADVLRLALSRLGEVALAALYVAQRDESRYGAPDGSGTPLFCGDVLRRARHPGVHRIKIVETARGVKTLAAITGQEPPENRGRVSSSRNNDSTILGRPFAQQALESQLR
jgi:site-specific DNA recombinase